MAFPHDGVKFRPGESGNPAGKPKGVKHINTWIQELMEDEAFEANILGAKTGIREYKGAPIKAIVQVAMVKAINGDTKAMEWLAKYGWSQKQEVDVTTKGEAIAQPMSPETAAKFAEFLKGQ